MKALSFWQPWASLIVRDEDPKDIENRTWPMRYLPVRLIVHAGKKVDPDARAVLADMGEEWPDPMPLGALIGEVEVQGSFTIEEFRKTGLESKWAVGPHCWHLANPLRYPEPIPYSGQQGFFDVDQGLLPEPPSVPMARAIERCVGCNDLIRGGWCRKASVFDCGTSRNGRTVIACSRGGSRVVRIDQIIKCPMGRKEK